MVKNILVFPCGSEIALEIYRSLQYSIHFKVIGANSVDDHGKFVYQDYIGGLPLITDDNFIEEFSKVIKERHIDAVFPAMDLVFDVLKKNEDVLQCKIIGSCKETVDICTSKTKTYLRLKNIVKVPELYSLADIVKYPVFSKPDIGYGSRGAKVIYNPKMLSEYSAEYPNNIYCEYLPGEEYTVDCFTDRYGILRFAAPRQRRRIMNGISVNTIPVIEKMEFIDFVEKINQNIRFRGAWFVQLKRDKNNKLTLLEIAARLGGSSSLFRMKGINFALLTLFDAFDYDVDIIENDYSIELDRALDSVYKIDINYDEVFVDFDDCILCNGKLNIDLLSFLYQSINQGKKITLLTRHSSNISVTLKKYRLTDLFDRVIHLKSSVGKSQYIDNKNSIFIDDSFSERKDVSENSNIPVFSPDMIKSLMK